MFCDEALNREVRFGQKRFRFQPDFNSFSTYLKQFVKHIKQLFLSLKDRSGEKGGYFVAKKKSVNI